MPQSTNTNRITPSANDLVLTVNQIQGVHASCVILDSAQSVNEIHIVASDARKPKQIVRDVETMLFVKHGIKIDYRTISLVQISDEQMLRIPIARPGIDQVTEEITGDQRRVRVTIHGASHSATGEAFDRVDSPNTLRVAVNATINALEKLLHNRIDVRLSQVQTFHLDSREVLLVIVTTLIDEREESFLGSSFVGARPIESAARATLDALNRRIHNLTLQAPRESEELDSV